MSAQSPSPVFKPGDIAYRKSWNFPRLLIVTISGVDREFATCISEHDNEDTFPVGNLETREQWLAGCRKTGEDSEMSASQVERYIEEGIATFEGKTRWKAALERIERESAAAPLPESSVTEDAPQPVRIDARLIHRIGVREWGLPSMCVPGKMWRSEKHGTICCMLPHPTDPNLVTTETLPLIVTDSGGKQWMPDSWRAALWDYVQVWPLSGCGYGPFLAITEAERCDFLRKMAADLVKSDNIGCRLIAHDIGQFAAVDYQIIEVEEPTVTRS